MTSSPGSPCAEERVRRRGAWTPPKPRPHEQRSLWGAWLTRWRPPCPSRRPALASPGAELQALLQARPLPWTSWGQRAPGVAVLGPCLPRPPPPVRVAAPRLPGELCPAHRAPTRPGRPLALPQAHPRGSPRRPLTESRRPQLLALRLLPDGKFCPLRAALKEPRTRCVMSDTFYFLS